MQQLPVHIELLSDKSVPPPSFLMLGSRPQRFCVVGRFCLCCDGTQDLVHLLDPRRAFFSEWDDHPLGSEHTLR